MIPLGKIAFHPRPAAGAAPPAAAIAPLHPGRPFRTLATNGSLIEPPNCCPGEAMAEKSPALSAPVGTITCEPDCPCTMRRPSYDTKKKVRYLFMGPPNVPPNWF